MNVSASVILSVVLLAEAMISRFLTGSAMHLALVLCAAVVFGGFRLIGPSTARAAGFGCAAAVSLGGWHLLHSGLVPITYSELPGLYHIAIGIHFFLWARMLGARQRSRSKAVSIQKLGAPSLAAGVFAGAVVAWTTGTVEIYGASPFLVRSLGFVALAGSILAGEQSKRGATTHFAAALHQTWKSAAFLFAMILAAVFIFAALIPPAQRVASRLYTWYGIDDGATRLEDFGSSRPALQSGSGDSSGAGRELPRKADIELSDSLRFFLEAEDDESFRRLTRNRVYARTSTLSVFADDGRLAPLRRGEWRYDSDDGREDGRVSLTKAPPDSAATVNYSILIESRDSRALPLVARPRSVILDSVFAYADDWYQLALDDEQERVRFRATSIQQTVQELLESGTKLEAAVAPNDYLRLPPTPLAGRVREAAVLAAEDGSKDLETLLPRIRNWLGNRCSYSLRYENPDDLTPVENFLFQERKGHCELFAAGTVMLLRSLGIPSRIAYGYCGGAADFSKRVMAFRESDFHAWAEIYLVGHGWVVFETTPDGYGAVQQPQNQTGGPAFADVNLAGYEFLGEFDLTETAEVSDFSILIRRVTEFASDWFFAICGGIIALGTVILWLRRRKNRRLNGPGSTSLWPGKSAGKRERTPDFLAEYQQTCRNLGFEKRPSQTWGEFLRSLKRAGVCKGEFDELTRYVYGIRYAGRERDNAREREFRDSVKSFAEALE